jgi:hypothetical protein
LRWVVGRAPGRRQQLRRPVPAALRLRDRGAGWRDSAACQGPFDLAPAVQRLRVMRHTAIWIDEDEARVLHVDGASFDEHTVHAPAHHLHRHPKHQEMKTRNHPQDERRFFDSVLATLEGRDDVLLLGPSVTKLHFLRYAQEHSPAAAARVVGVETADHPSDKQIAAHVRHYFHGDLARRGVAH